MTKLYKYMAYVLGLILISTVLITIFEYDHFSEVLRKPLGEITVIDVLMQSLWWSVATITTVGYGDITPVSGSGKLIAMVCMLAGYGLKLYILIDVFRHYTGTSNHS